MDKYKKIGKKVKTWFVVLGILGIGLLVHRKINDWPTRYRSELNTFFGKGNWEVVDKERKRNRLYKSQSNRTSWNESSTSLEHSRFIEWTLEIKDRNNETEQWVMKDLIWRISRYEDKFLSKRWSRKEALGRQLMEKSFEIIGEEIGENILNNYLPKNELDCLRVEMSYENGNPDKKFYKKLLNKSWFRADTVSAEHFFELTEKEFFIEFFAFDYKIDKLTEEERNHLMSSLQTIEEAMLCKYGENASFKIYFDDEHQVKYSKGKLVSKKK